MGFIPQVVQDNPKTSAAIGLGVLVAGVLGYRHFKAAKAAREEREAKKDAMQEKVVEAIVNAATPAPIAAATPVAAPVVDNSAELTAVKAELAALKKANAQHTTKPTRKGKHGRR
jgi:hypothetical protein